MLQYFNDSGYEYTSEYGFDPVLEEVVKVKNMYYLHKYGNTFQNGIPAEFAKYGWLDGIEHIWSNFHHFLTIIISYPVQ